MKQTNPKSLWLVMLTATLMLTLQSCDNDEPYYGESSWFAGRAFAAYAHAGAYNDLWVIDFYWNGEFLVSPCDPDGNAIPGLETYEGTYSVNYDLGRIYLSYYGYSMNSVWTFRWLDQYDPYTGTYPDMEIYTAPGRGPLDNLTFTPFPL